MANWKSIKPCKKIGPLNITRKLGEIVNIDNGRVRIQITAVLPHAVRVGVLCDRSINVCREPEPQGCGDCEACIFGMRFGTSICKHGVPTDLKCLNCHEEDR